MSDQPRKIRKTSEQESNAYANNKTKRRKKSKTPIWLPLVIVLVLIGGAGFYAWSYVNNIMQQIAPETDAPSIADEVKTAEAYKGDVVGILLVGIDLSNSDQEDGSNNGLTDMMMYVQFDVKNNKMNMLQIPRNIYVGLEFTCEDTTGNSYRSSNGQINAVAMSNSENGVGNIAALADTIANNYGLPIDHYVSIETSAFKALVDHFGGIEVYVPQDMEYNGSLLKEGYQNLDGDAAEFMVRNRNYATSDLERLNMQRYVYAGMFNRVQTAAIQDVIKLMPVVVSYVKTDCNLTTLIELGISFLSLDSADIMVCQAPAFTGTEMLIVGHNSATGKPIEQSVLVGAPEHTAELLNEYFAAYSGPIDASSLNLAEWPHNGISSEPNVQFMGQLDSEAQAAQAEQEAAA